MSKESATEKIHLAVEEAIEADMSVREFIQNASISWTQVLNEKERHASDDFNKILATKGVY